LRLIGIWIPRVFSPSVGSERQRPVALTEAITNAIDAAWPTASPSRRIDVARGIGVSPHRRFAAPASRGIGVSRHRRLAGPPSRGIGISQHLRLVAWSAHLSARPKGKDLPHGLF
jgi:hypothetical protein